MAKTLAEIKDQMAIVNKQITDENGGKPVVVVHKVQGIKTPVQYTISDPNRFAFATFYDSDGNTINPEQIVTALNQAADLTARIKVLEAALGHYADEKNWVESATGCGENFYVGDGDNGYDIAKAALQEKSDDK